MGAIYAATLFAAFGHTVNMTTVILPLVGVLFIVLGNFLGKIRPNWFVGIRTPWTLSSQLSWDKTHRLAGWLFVLMGILFFPVAAIQTTWSLITMLVIDAVCVAWLIVYSYLVYRNDPHRTSPAGTLPSNE
jgi:immunity protein, SdpI family